MDCTCISSARGGDNARHTGTIPRGPKISLAIHPETLVDSSSNPPSLTQYTRQLESGGSDAGLRTGGDNRRMKEKYTSLKKCHISHCSEFPDLFFLFGLFNDAFQLR
jgi:hypothetical protein